MDFHRILSVLIIAAGTITALIGVGIAGLGVLVRVRVAASRAHDAGLDA
jgi:hypothetical protein